MHKLKFSCLTSCFLILCSCGGSSNNKNSNNPFLSELNGKWIGSLSGHNCDDVRIEKFFNHNIVGHNDSLDSVILMTDQNEVKYTGNYVVSADDNDKITGISLDDDKDSDHSFAYDLISKSGDVADIFEYTKGVDQNDVPCNYTLTGIARKD